MKLFVLKITKLFLYKYCFGDYVSQLNSSAWLDI